MTDGAILAVEAAAASNPTRGFEEEHSAPALQFAVARAVFEGSPIREIAAAAHMTPLEVLDASDALTYSGLGDSAGRGPLTTHNSAAIQLREDPS